MEECQRYFKERPVFQKVFELLKEKYEGLGHFGGTIQLKDITEEEKVQLGGFFQKDYTRQKSITISYVAIEKALAQSRFYEFSWQEILETYFDSELLIKKQEQMRKEQEKREFFQKLEDICITVQEKDWLHTVINKQGAGYQIMIKQYKEDKRQLVKIIQTVLRACRAFPVYENKVELLPVFATRTTGNPHCFDEGTKEEQLLCSYLNYILRPEVVFGISKTEQKGKLLYQVGIMRDELWNFVLTYNLHGRKKDGSIHEGLEGFAQEQEPVTMTLQTLSGLEKIWADRETVYIVENPAVFSYLCKKYPHNAFLCGNGQLRLATWLVLDLLQEQSTFLYAGDFDPEGLLIAQNLKLRYQDKLSFWNYEKSYFINYLSNVEISERSLKKLDNIHIDELIEIRDEMYRVKKAVYQEAMLEEYCI